MMFQGRGMGSHNDSEIPTNPGTPKAKRVADKMQVNVPSEGRLSAGELRDFVIVFRTLAEDIKIIEERQDKQDKLLEKYGAQINELHKFSGRIDTTIRDMGEKLDNFMAEIRRMVNRERR